MTPICTENAYTVDAEKAQGHNDHNRTDIGNLFQGQMTKLIAKTKTTEQSDYSIIYIAFNTQKAFHLAKISQLFLFIARMNDSTPI